MNLTLEMRTALKHHAIRHIISPRAIMKAYCCEKRAELIRDGLFELFSLFTDMPLRARERLACADELFEEAMSELGYEKTPRGYVLNPERSRIIFTTWWPSASEQRHRRNELHQSGHVQLCAVDDHVLIRLSSAEVRKEYEQILQDEGTPFTIGAHANRYVAKMGVGRE